MPRKPKHPCGYPGCAALTEKRYCPEHEKLTSRQYEKYGRDPKTRSRYGRAWHRIRQSYVKEHPFCEECMKNGKLVPVDQVHHKKPLAEGGSHERSNLISLCAACHARIHAERGDRWHNKEQGVGGIKIPMGNGNGQRCHSVVCKNWNSNRVLKDIQKSISQEGS